MKNITSSINESRPETPVSYRTVGRVLNKNNIYSRIQATKKEITKENTFIIIRSTYVHTNVKLCNFCPT